MYLSRLTSWVVSTASGYGLGGTVVILSGSTPSSGWTVKNGNKISIFLRLHNQDCDLV